MPLYDYRCADCEQIVEVMHGIHDQGPEICEACGGQMRKALSTPAIHFKGSGWAKKDAAAASAKKAKPKASPSTPATSGDKSSADGAKAGPGESGESGGSTRSGSDGASSGDKSGSSPSSKND